MGVAAVAGTAADAAWEAWSHVSRVVEVVVGIRSVVMGYVVCLVKRLKSQARGCPYTMGLEVLGCCTAADGKMYSEKGENDSARPRRNAVITAS